LTGVPQKIKLLVADFHRNMIQGGIYMYPPVAPGYKGKLRLLFECNPLAFIAEQAGGKASNGEMNIMEIEPTELHQRVPIYIGSTEMVDKAEEMLRKAKMVEKV
jgi:fructose-1,6-bisphosphatase I